MVLTLLVVFVLGALPFLTNLMKYVGIEVFLIITFRIENTSLLNTGKKKQNNLLISTSIMFLICFIANMCITKEYKLDDDKLDNYHFNSLKM